MLPTYLKAIIEFELNLKINSAAELQAQRFDTRNNLRFLRIWYWAANLLKKQAFQNRIIIPILK